MMFLFNKLNMFADDFQHLRQHFGISRNDITCTQPVLFAVKIGYDATSFLYNQCPSGDVPRFQIEFKKPSNRPAANAHKSNAAAPSRLAPAVFSKNSRKIAQ